VHLNGIDLHVERRGEGEPLVLLHGGGGAGVNWRLVFDAPPSGYELVVPDLRGHGRSTNAAAPITFRQLALDVAGLMDHLGIERFKAIGMSLGAKTLLHLATGQPERIEAMVLVSGAPCGSFRVADTARFSATWRRCSHARRSRFSAAGGTRDASALTRGSMPVRVNYAIVFVSDMTRSVSFYRDVVGLPLRFESPQWTEFATDGATLALHASERPGSEDTDPDHVPAGRCRPGIAVLDLDAFHRKMVERGVPCVQAPKDVFGARLAQYLDPDGLAISVGEERPLG